MRRATGSVTVEFAIIATLFVMLLMAVVEFGRWIATLEMVVDATRKGARMAVVCTIDEGAVKTRMQQLVPQLDLASSQIVITYAPAGCTSATCRSVSVQLTGATFTPLVPGLSSAFAIPPYTTTLPRELLDSTNNPACS